MFPPYLTVPAEDLGRGTSVKVRVLGDMMSLGRDLAEALKSEILQAKRLRLYCNRPWQGAFVRRVLHGPLPPDCPASLMRTHPDAILTVADYVAAPPEIRLR